MCGTYFFDAQLQFNRVESLTLRSDALHGATFIFENLDTHAIVVNQPNMKIERFEIQSKGANADTAFFCTAALNKKNCWRNNPNNRHCSIINNVALDYGDSAYVFNDTMDFLSTKNLYKNIDASKKPQLNDNEYFTTEAVYTGKGLDRKIISNSLLLGNGKPFSSDIKCDSTFKMDTYLDGEPIGGAWNIGPFGKLSMNVASIGIENLEQPEIYPNPMSNWLTIAWSKVKKFHYQLINLNGQILKVSSTNHQKISIPIQDLTSGMYILVIYDEDQSIQFVKKVIKH